MRVFWNCGSRLYALVTSCMSSINTSWGCVLSLISDKGVLSSINFCLTGTCASLLIAVNFLFDEAIVLTRVLALLSCGVSYQSGALAVASSAETSVVITLNLVEVCREFCPEFCVDALEERCGWPLVLSESPTFELPLSPIFESAQSSL